MIDPKRPGLLLTVVGATFFLWSWRAVAAAAAADPNDDDFGGYRSDGSPCDFYQVIDPGNRSYYLYSPGYPDAYRTDQEDSGQRECRWFAKTSSPTDRLVLDCHEFDLPEVRVKTV